MRHTFHRDCFKREMYSVSIAPLSFTATNSNPQYQLPVARFEPVDAGFEVGVAIRLGVTDCTINHQANKKRTYEKELMTL